MVFEESHLQFDFQEGEWANLVKYDEEKDYRKLERNIPETKAVDFIGISNDTIYFIEVKNYRGYRIESKTKIEELDIIIAKKVRDTLAGILGGTRNSTHKKEVWRQHLAHLRDKNKPLHIILWMEESSHHPKRQKVFRDTLTRRLKKRLSWLSNRIIISDTANNPLEDILWVDFLAEP